MITESTIYWITRLDGLKDGCIGVGVTFTILFIITAFFSCMIRFDEEDKKATKYIVISFLGIIFAISCIFANVFIPTTKQMCAIKALPLVLNSKDVQEIPEKVLDLANEWMDELRPIKGGDND